MAIYHFHVDEEGTAGKFASAGARLCIELGLNKQQNILRAFSTGTERQQAILCFWSAYTLDRRSSIGLGLPYILQDGDIDTEAPKAFSDSALLSENATVNQDFAHESSNQYVTAMIKFTQLSGEACEIINKVSDNRQCLVPCQELEYLDYKVLQWHRRIPDQLKLRESELEANVSRSNYDTSVLFLQVVLQARMNQLRNLIFRPLLYQQSRIWRYPDQARTAMEVAKESINLLWTVNESSEIIRSNPVFFKHFIVSAIGLLLLAIVNAWKELGQQVAHEFYLALDLFKILSTESFLVKQYSATIGGLEELAHKIGLPRQQVDGSHIAPTQGVPVTLSGFEVPARANDTHRESFSVDQQINEFGGEGVTVDVRDEFFNFLDLDDGQASAFFDFDLGHILSSDTSNV